MSNLHRDFEEKSFIRWWPWVRNGYRVFLLSTSIVARFGCCGWYKTKKSRDGDTNTPHRKNVGEPCMYDVSRRCCWLCAPHFKQSYVIRSMLPLDSSDDALDRSELHATFLHAPYSNVHPRRPPFLSINTYNHPLDLPVLSFFFSGCCRAGENASCRRGRRLNQQAESPDRSIVLYMIAKRNCNNNHSAKQGRPVVISIIIILYTRSPRLFCARRLVPLFLLLLLDDDSQPCAAVYFDHVKYQEIAGHVCLSVFYFRKN